jgi:GNAT superfamily N-acetyltransferase
VSEQILAIPEADVPAGLRRQVVALQRQAWPSERPVTLEPRHDPALRPVSMLLVAGGRVVSALDILSKDLGHAGVQFSASGLSTVVTERELQGRGYGRRLVVAARRRIERSGADLGIFTCDRPLQQFYESAGWEVLPGSVLVGGTPELPFPSDRLDKVTMAGFFSPRAIRRAETFAGARIELFPGLVDKLW